MTSSIPQTPKDASRVGSAVTNPANSEPRTFVPAGNAPSIWLHRTGLVFYVCMSLWAGMVLLILPWTTAWNNLADGGFFIQHLELRTLALHGFVRGALSGMGLVNIWMGIWEGVHYRDPAR